MSDYPPAIAAPTFDAEDERRGRRPESARPTSPTVASLVESAGQAARRADASLDSLVSRLSGVTKPLPEKPDGDRLSLITGAASTLAVEAEAVVRMLHDLARRIDALTEALDV